MSTSVRLAPLEKKISSFVRPGVRDVRARALRPVSALIRLDLPTLERPASAISMPRIGGSELSELAAETNCQSPAKSSRPLSFSSRVNWAVIGASAFPAAPGGHPCPRPADTKDADGRDKPGHDVTWKRALNLRSSGRHFLFDEYFSDVVP